VNERQDTPAGKELPQKAKRTIVTKSAADSDEEVDDDLNQGSDDSSIPSNPMIHITRLLRLHLFSVIPS